MPISIDWGAKVISVPQSYLTFVSGVRYDLDIEQFFRDCRDLTDDEVGMVFPPVVRHSTEYTISGVTYVRAVEVINGYVVRFQDTGSFYLINCVGANHNIGDVIDLTWTANFVLLPNNSAGLIKTNVGTPAEVAGAVWGALRSGYQDAGSFGEGVRLAAAAIKASTFEAGAIDAAAVASGAIDADALATGAITSAKFAAGAVDAVALATDAAQEIADVLLDRDMSAGTDSGSATVRTVRQALRYLRNRRRINLGQIDVYKEDDSTQSWTGTVQTAAGDPITEVNPAGGS